MGQVVDFLEFKKKKEEDAAWNFLHSGVIGTGGCASYDYNEVDYLLRILENINMNDPDLVKVDGDTIYISLEENSLKQEDE